MKTIAEEVEEILDSKVHMDLCACDGFPQMCSTYGKRIPWTHSNIEEIVEVTLRVQQKHKVYIKNRNSKGQDAAWKEKVQKLAVINKKLGHLPKRGEEMNSWLVNQRQAARGKGNTIWSQGRQDYMHEHIPDWND